MGIALLICSFIAEDLVVQQSFRRHGRAGPTIRCSTVWKSAAGCTAAGWKPVERSGQRRA